MIPLRGVMSNVRGLFFLSPYGRSPEGGELAERKNVNLLCNVTFVKQTVRCFTNFTFNVSATLKFSLKIFYVADEKYDRDVE